MPYSLAGAVEAEVWKRDRVGSWRSEAGEFEEEVRVDSQSYGDRRAQSERNHDEEGDFFDRILRHFFGGFARFFFVSFIGASEEDHTEDPQIIGGA